MARLAGRLPAARSIPARTAAVHLAGLSAFAIGKPLYDLLTAGTLAEWYFRPLDVVLTGVGLALVPPAVALLLELAVGLVSRAARYWLHLGLVFGFAFLIVAYALRRALPDHTGFPVLLTAVVVAALATAAYHAAAGVRSFVSLLGLAAPLFLVMFLFTSSASKIVFPSDTMAIRAGAAPTPVVLVVFDEFPGSSLMTANGRIDAVRYPSFGALARTSTWYRNAITAHDFTRFSVPAILSGQYSRPHVFPVSDDHRRTLFQLLGRTHRLQDFESVTRMCPPNLCDQHLQGRFPVRVTRLVRQATREYLRLLFPEHRFARQVFPTQHPDWDIDRFTRALATRSSRPRFAFTELQTPHNPYLYLPSGRRYRDPRVHVIQGIGRGATSVNRLLADAQLQRHLAQVAFTDRMLGRILATLRRTGELDRALVIVTADHGISLKPGTYDLEHRLTTAANAADTGPVPLFVKLPRQRRGRIDDSYARNIDIPATVAATLHVRMPWRSDGRPLGPPRPIPPTFTIRRSSGRALTIASVALLRGRDAQAARVARLGPGPADPGLFRFGPRPDLYGRSLRSVPRGGGSAVAVELDEPHAFDRVDLRAEVPGYVTGTVTGSGAKAVRRVAVAVNGRVAATTWTYVHLGRVRFAALTGDRWLRQGRNSVAVVPL